MNIKIVKKGTFNNKPLSSCPLLVDDDGGPPAPRK
jgi:hypothetical protein